MSNGGYQPKLDPEALLLGYIGADPKAAGMIKGYTQKQTTVHTNDSKKQGSK